MQAVPWIAHRRPFASPPDGVRELEHDTQALPACVSAGRCQRLFNACLKSPTLTLLYSRVPPSRLAIMVKAQRRGSELAFGRVPGRPDDKDRRADGCTRKPRALCPAAGLRRSSRRAPMATRWPERPSTGMHSWPSSTSVAPGWSCVGIWPTPQDRPGDLVVPPFEREPVRRAEGVQAYRPAGR